MADGTSLDVGPGASGQLRWRRLDGRTGALTPQGNDRWSSTLGWTDRSDGHYLPISDCARGEIRFDDVAGQRAPLIQVDTTFQGSGVVLAGRLTLPPGQARVPIVVLVHGAEHSSALETYALQRQFASAGIGVFAYDKRGTGSSGGRYSQNYLLLATYIAFDMERAGFGPEIKAKAMEVADATAMIVASNFTDGYDQLETVKRKYGEEPWFKSVRGNVTAYLLATPTETSRKEGPSLLEGVPAQYDPMPVLANLEVPQLWILGGEDRDAPPGETIRRLAVLRKSGRPITTVVFPGADHGMYEFETLPNGERVSTRQPEDYFTLMRDFIKGSQRQR
jgi:hypothetical protein